MKLIAQFLISTLFLVSGTTGICRTNNLENIVHFWGSETNGLRAGVSMRPEHKLLVWIEATDPTQTSSIDFSTLRTNRAIPPPLYSSNYFDSNSPVYHYPSNGFPGMLELLDPSGRKLKPTKPEVTSSETYPRFTRWSRRTGGISYFLGPDRWPIGGKSVDIDLRGYAQYGSFRPSDYFEIGESGEYELRIIPVLYKRSDRPEDDRDVYVRIDLPPVAVPLQLQPNIQKTGNGS